MTFYEKSLKASGWKETSRTEDNSGPGKTHRIVSGWAKEKRTAQVDLTQVSPEKTQLELRLGEHK